jgi:hypothetical protein
MVNDQRRLIGMSSRSFVFHQTLHGYVDGHGLIRSSSKVPADTAHLMLIMSDMSGPSMIRGFETYLTGYPLREIKSYALARTWYAPEMKRPGCVWTHTLIIRNTDLGYIPDLWSLIDLLKRPSSSPDLWGNYATTITLLAHEIRSPPVANYWKREPNLKNVIHGSVKALYGSPNSQVFLPVERTTAEYEEFTIALWSQQWPRLRREFRFCTGSISNRRTIDGTFDWQIIPKSTQREIMRTFPTAVFISTEGEDQTEKLPRWMELAVDDLCRKSSSSFRRFLRRFGMETSKGRASFRSMVEVYLAYQSARQNPTSLSGLIAATAHLFPSPNDGESLKTALFGPNGNRFTPQYGRLSQGWEEADLLQALGNTSHFSAFDPESLSITERATSLVRIDQERASEIAHSFLEGELTPIRERFIDGLIEALLSYENPDSVNIDINLISLLVQRQPQFSRSPFIWRRSPTEQRLIFSLIKDSLLAAPEDVKGVIFSILDASSEAITQDLANSFESTVGIVLDWCTIRGLEFALAIGAEWKEILTTRPGHCIEWIKSNDQKEKIDTVVFLATILNPHSGSISNSDLSVWLEAAKRTKELLKGDTLTRAMSFFLALGFNNPTHQGAKFVVEAFEFVYAAAAENRLTENAWWLLSSQCPSVSWNGYWDRCERLRGALIDQFMKFRWPYEDLLNSLKTRDLLERVVAQALEHGGWFYSQRHYIREVGDQVLSGRLNATAEQREVFSAY